MKIYEIVIEEPLSGKMSSEKTHYILAQDFVEASKKAGKILKNAQADYEDSYIESISEQLEVEVVK